MGAILFIFLLLSSEVILADVMNLNNFMPTQLEDAAPIDAHSMDVQYSVALEKMGKDIVLHRPNVRYGMNQHLQLEAQATVDSGGSEFHSGESEFNLLYRVNQSSSMLPEVSLSPLAIFPSGKGMSGVDYGVRINFSSLLMGTSKRPLTQLHFNFQIVHNNEARQYEVLDRYLYALGASHRLADETALVLDVMSNEDPQGKKSYLVELGWHQGLGKEFYLGVSASAGLGASEIKQMGIIALEKQFN